MKRASVIQPRRALLIDTNILLLLVVGACDPNLIESFGPTKSSKYTARDYDLVWKRIARFGSDPDLVTTPHILTEVSNFLGRSLREPAKSRCRQMLATMIRRMRERCEPARELGARQSFVRLGITDAAIEELSGKSMAVFTDDWELSAIAERRGAEVWNLRRLRSVL